MAAELVPLRVAVVVATSTPANVVAAKATTEIPIVFTNPSNPNAKTQSDALEVAARTIGLQIETQSVTTESEIDAVFARLAERRTSALLVDTDAFLFNRRAQLVGLAKRYSISTIFDRRKYTEAGGS